MDNLPGFGQLIIGPPGSGKTTYCHAVKQFLEGIGRKVAIFNLDPANDNMPFSPDWDLSEIICLKDVMDLLKLGPNGALLYCLEFIEKNFQQMESKLIEFKKEGYYFLFDCPGQVELYTHHASVHNIVDKLTKLDIRLVALHLVDSHYCSDASKFISVLLTSLSTMLQVALPHINVLSKIDLLEKYGKLAFDIDYFTEVMDLNYLVRNLKEDPNLKKFAKFNEALIGIIQDYSLVSFSKLHVEDKESMLNLMKLIDQANGYIYGGLSEQSKDVMDLLSQKVGMNCDFKVDAMDD